MSLKTMPLSDYTSTVRYSDNTIYERTSTLYSDGVVLDEHLYTLPDGSTELIAFETRLSHLHPDTAFYLEGVADFLNYYRA